MSVDASVIGGVLLLFVAVVAVIALGALYYSMPSRPALDRNTLCPIAGPEGITVVLVDTSDDLSPTTTREVMGILNDLVTGLPPYYRLDIRVLDIQGNRSRSLFSKCNPGDGVGLSEWTDNPRIARMRWIESFRKPAAEAIRNSLSSAKANSSPIMAAIQDIAIDQFSTSQSRSAKKSLVVISDMIEHTREYSQYRNADLTYPRFKQSPAYLKYRTDLHQALVTIDYVSRPNVMPETARHVSFWDAWVKDNAGVLVAIHRLQGT
ncbi:hypothetical protein [Bradyrhizobium sp. CCBAU 53338]|uniref:hypothetical protein n=1 Tax=Bradyrhizobium sp. CCBAU 53338 TaxID=1325111 RepID=UPI00188A4A34|nr:hypothetical protein [Bradyrhizobium sp. CCBAU 53338]QOZ51522.1 hypothetical protein XH90_09120 [Bradyrhizobium sp. CCBAU 53338]